MPNIPGSKMEQDNIKGKILNNKNYEDEIKLNPVHMRFVALKLIHWIEEINLAVECFPDIEFNVLDDYYKMITTQGKLFESFFWLSEIKNTKIQYIFNEIISKKFYDHMAQEEFKEVIQELYDLKSPLISQILDDFFRGMMKGMEKLDNTPFTQ